MSMSQKLLRMLRRALSICLQNQQSAECNRQVKHDQIVHSVSISVRWNFLVFLASMDTVFLVITKNSEVNRRPINSYKSFLATFNLKTTRDATSLMDELYFGITIVYFMVSLITHVTFSMSYDKIC